MKLLPEQNTLLEEKTKATIFDIQRNSFVDGPGIRTTVFFKGCNVRCAWCHNPESQNFKKEILFYKNKCTECGRCKELSVDNENFFCLNEAKQICGRKYTIQEVLNEIMKDKAYYQSSGGGVTFSGGECMLQIDFLEEILKKCKENNVHTAIDTAGNVPWESFEKIIPYTDLFLYDIKCFTETLHIKGTGVSNKLILENLKKLSDKSKGDIIIRIPVVSGFNDSAEEIMHIANFLKNIHYRDIDLLPYHKMGAHKYEALGIECTDYYIPEKENIKKYKHLLSL